MDSSCLWAKLSPFQSVRTHGIVSGIVAQAVYRMVLTDGNQKLLQSLLRLDEKSLARFLGYLVSVHDIGKIECTFQSGDAEMKQRIIVEGLAEKYITKSGIRHEKSSKEALQRIWKKQGMDRKAYKFYVGIVKAHHQGKIGDGQKGSALWQQLQDSFETEMRCVFWEENAQLPTFDEKDRSCIAALLLGILILSDWIASGETFSDAETVLQQAAGMQVVQNRAEAFFSENGFIAEPISWDNWIGIDAEDVNRSTQIIGEYLVEIVWYDESYCLYWTDNAYIYSLELPNSISEEVMIEIFSSIRPIDQDVNQSGG